MEREVTVARIYLHEADHGRRKSLMQEILSILHDQQRVKTAIVFRGIAGMDASGEIVAADMLRILVDLPLVIEFFDEPAVVDAVLAQMGDLLHAGQVVTWRAVCR